MSIEDLQARVRRAFEGRQPLRVRGGGTKDFYGNAPRGDVLDTRAHAGIAAYEPTELVVTARCGTALADLEAALAQHRQMLPFEPPHFGAGATLGGCIAAGLAGPRRAAAGALRDFVLGVKMIDGRGQLLSFGGQVMKNVAGYDVSRVLAGSLGTLGVIAEASIKLAPRPELEATLGLEMPQARALEAMNRWAGQPLPITASAWHDDTLMVRLSGSAQGVRAAAARIGGEALQDDVWSAIREQRHEFFTGDMPLWRLAVPPVTPPLEADGFVEWGGALRWLRSTRPAAEIRRAASAVKGHATLFRAADKSAGCFGALDPVVMRIHRELKAAFDPAGILNPGRMYAEL